MSHAIQDAKRVTRTRRVPTHALLAAILIAAALSGLLATPHAATAHAVRDAGAELTNLLRAMALLKLAIVGGAAWLLVWRLKHPASPALTTAYLASLAAVAAGPGLIWGNVHVIAGAALLHAGLASLLVSFWRDPGSPAMLPRARANRPQKTTAAAITSVATSPVP